MGFVALSAHAAGRDLTDTGIVPENIEAGLLSEEGRSAAPDCGEIAEVDSKTLDLSRACWVKGLYGLDFGGDFGGGAPGHIDCAAAGVEDFDKFKSDTSISSSDDEDFSCERREVLLGEGWA